MTHFKLTKPQIAYIIPSVLLNLWLLAMGWLNTSWTKLKLGNDFTTINYVLFFFALAFGTGIYALFLDKLSSKQLKRIAILSTVILFTFTCLVPFCPSALFNLFFLLTAICAGFFSTYLTYYILLSIPRHQQGMTLGLSGGISTLIHFLIFTLLLPQETTSILVGKSILSAIIVLFAGIATIRLTISDHNLCESPIHTSLPSTLFHQKPKILPVLTFILICFYLSYGMQDFAATAHWLEGKGFLVYTRLFMVLGFVLGGLLWDMKQRHMLLITSFGLLLMGFVCMGLEYKGLASFIGFAGVQLASVFFSLTIRLIFIEIAGFYKKSLLICALGIILTSVFKQLGILTAWIFYLTLGPLSIFIASLLFVVLGLPFVSVLYDKIVTKNLYAIRITTPILFEVPKSEEQSLSLLDEFIKKYGLTRREGQVLELSSHGQTISEMALNLHISEPTVKHYVKQILTKTDMKNQKQVLALLFENSTK